MPTSSSACSAAAIGPNPPDPMDMMTLTHPCGHTSSIDDGFVKLDHFICPDCGLEWHVHQAPPEILRSGYRMPGKRTVILHDQLSLPKPP